MVVAVIVVVMAATVVGATEALEAVVSTGGGGETPTRARSCPCCRQGASRLGRNTPATESVTGAEIVTVHSWRERD
jgi:hypothetical protein